MLTEKPFRFESLVKPAGTMAQIFDMKMTGNTQLDLETYIQSQWLWD
jgi:hypothetical protein